MTGPRGRALGEGVLALGLVLVLFIRPWMHGIPPAATALFWAFVLVHVALPGIAVCWATQRFRGDATLLVGQGCSLGLLLQALGYFGARALGVPALASVFPLAVAVGALGLGRLGSRPEAPERVRSPVSLLLLLLLLAASVQPLVTERHVGSRISVDLLFHSGNAAEVRHRWPLESPRIAGLPLKYQVLVYALPAGASDWSGLPVADVLLALCPLLWLPLVVIQVLNAGRALFRDRYAGLLGAAIVVLHADPGRLLGLGRGAFNSYLATGLYASPTTVCGFILLASMAVALSEWLSDPEETRRSLAPLALLALLSLAASAAKASVLPTVGGGLAALALWAWPRRRDVAVAALVALAVVGLSGAPVTLWLTAGEGSYHGMLRLGPAAAMKSSAFLAWLARLTGAGWPPPAWLGLLALLPWLIGYLGLAGVGFLVWAAGRRPPLSPSQVWALAAAATGAALGLSLEAFGLSQLFFFYNGQVLLALFSGAGIVLALREGRRLSRVLLLGSSLPSLLLAWVLPLEAHRDDRRILAREWSAAEAQYAVGLRWLREHAATGSVVLADNGSLYLSAFGECRMLYESGLYSPHGDVVGESSPDRFYAERVDLQDRLLRRTDRESVEAVVGRFPPGTTVRIVADSVQTRIEGGIEVADIGPVPGRRLFPRELFELEFANDAMHVYRVSRALERGPDLPSNRATP